MVDNFFTRNLRVIKQKMLGLGLALLVLFFQSTMASTSSGLFFKVTANNLTLNIKTTVPHHVYQAAGIKIKTNRHELPGIGCTKATNGFCLFAVSDTAEAVIPITGGAGPVQIILCLDGQGQLSCQNYTVNLSQQLIPLPEGSFEKLTLMDNGWLQAIQPRSSGSFSLYNTTTTATPVSDFPILASPPCGLQAAIAGEEGPMSVALYRDVMLPSLPTGYKFTLSFQIAVQNYYTDYVAPLTLDYTGEPNQQVRVDVIKPTEDPFTMVPSEIWSNVFVTEAGSPLTIPYTKITFDLPGSLANQTVRIRFANVNNMVYLMTYVDCVGLVVQPAWV